MDIANLRFIDQQSIKNELHNYILKELDSTDVINLLPASTINIIENIAAGAASFMIYNAQMMKNERFLSKAVLDSSIFDLAHDYGYNISRAICPKVNLIYNSTESLILEEGAILGNVKGQDIDVIYFGESRTIEKGDNITVCLGKLVKIDEKAHLENNSLFYLLEPTMLSSIDNEAIKIRINNKDKSITKLVEDFVVWKEISDFSISNTSTKLLICDNTFKYGQYTAENDDIQILYLETNGEQPELETKDLDVNENFLVHSFLTKGVKSEDVEKIRELAPLLYTTQRRMVTPKDHIYIASDCPYFRSVGYKKDAGKPLIVKVSVLDSSAATYTVFIDDRPYTYIKKANDTTQDILNGISKLLNVNYQVDYFLENKNSLVVAKDSRNETTVSVSDSLLLETIQENVLPPCCTVYLYYVKHNVKDDPIELTDFEKEYVADYFDRYKFEGVRIIVLPASRISKDININIKISDNKYATQVIEKARDIIARYELRVHTNFVYGDLLADLAKIEVIDTSNKKIIRPIEYILPNQEPFNIVESPDNYIKFDKIEINFIEG